MTASSPGPQALPCPVCGWPAPPPGPVPCATCGLPAAGSAALAVARIGAGLDELARERDRFLGTLHAAAAGVPAPSPGAVPAAQGWAPGPSGAAPDPSWAAPGPSWAAPGPPGPSWAPPAAGPAVVPPPRAAPAVAAAPVPPPVPRPRVSPQQVLLGLGALLVVAAALAFVAVAWTRLGVAFQSLVMLLATAAACGSSAWAARRRLPATEEALAAAGAALLAVDLGAAHALGLAGLDAVPSRTWTAVSCAVVAAVAVALGRLTRSTLTWPVVGLLAAQPVALLLLPGALAAGAAGVAVVLAVALADLLVRPSLRPALQPVAVALAGAWAAGGALLGVGVAWTAGPADSWTATGLLAGAGAAALVLLADARLAAPLPAAPLVAGVGAGVAALALTGSLQTLGHAGPVTAAALGVALLTAAVLAAGRRPALAGLLAGGTVTAGVGSLLLEAGGRSGELSSVVLAATVPAALAAVRVPAVRAPAVGAALLCPAVAVLLAQTAGRLSPGVSGLLLALVAAVAFGLAAPLTPSAEERAAAGAGLVAGLAATATTASAGAWGQAALALAVTGAASGCYALVARRRLAALRSLALLVAACWTAAGGAGVGTPEAYTLPVAAALLLGAVPHLRAGARSWAAEGPAAVTALVPSALVVVAEPSAPRLVLVVAGAAALVVVGTLTARQAPFVVGAAALAFVVLGRLTPYAPLVPRWLSLAVAGLLLLVLGATYERRLQQARAAVTWVAQMR